LEEGVVGGLGLVGHEDVAGGGELDELGAGDLAGDEIGVGTGNEAIILAIE
jgi:hypothetical protein